MDKQELLTKMNTVAQTNPTLKADITKIFNAWRSNTVLNSDYDVMSEALDAFADIGVETILSIIDAFGRLKAETNGSVPHDQFMRMFKDTINTKRIKMGDLTAVRVLNITAPRSFTYKQGKNKGENGVIMNIYFYAGGQIQSVAISDEQAISVFQEAVIGRSYNIPLTLGTNGKYFIEGDPVLREIPSILPDADLSGFVKSSFPPLSLDVDLTPYIGTEQLYWLSGLVVSPRKSSNGWSFNLTDENKKSDMPAENLPTFWYNSTMSLHDMDRVLLVGKVVKGQKSQKISISVEFVHILNTLHTQTTKSVKQPAHVQSPVPPGMNPSAALNTSPPPGAQPKEAPAVPPSTTTPAVPSSTTTDPFNL